MIPTRPICRMPNLPAATGLLALLLAAGCRDREPAPPPPPPEVATLVIQPQEVVLTKEMPGRTSAYLVAEIRPQASGIVQQRRFTEGAEVKQGDILYEIDAGSYQAAYANAAAAVNAAKAGHATAVALREVAKAARRAAAAEQTRAEANVIPLRLRAERFGHLLASKAVSQQEVDDLAAALKQAEAGVAGAAAAVLSAEAEIQRAEATIQAAQAAIDTAAAGLETARIHLDYTRITAPIAGRIGRSAITTGALATAYQPLAFATIQQLDPIYVDVPQASADLLRLQRRLADGRLSHHGAETAAVKLRLEDGTAYPFAGKLQFRDVSVDPSTGSFILRLVFPNPDGMLLPGMFVRALVEEGINQRGILVPQQCVARDPKGQPFVLLVDAEGKVQQRLIATDRAIGDKWLVSSGLVPGDRVIVEGAQRARPGAAVREVPFAGGQPDAPAADSNDASPSPAN